MLPLRTDIGGNNPPADAAFALHIDDLFTMLSDTLAGGAVDNDEKDAAIDSLLDDFRKAAKDSDKERADEKRPHDDAAKAVQEKWKPIIAKADRGAAACKEALTPWRTEKQRIADDAARKAREDAEAKLKTAQELLKQPDDLAARFEAEQALEQSQKLVARANRIDRAPTGLRTSWEAEIADKGAALRFYLNDQPQEFMALIERLAATDARMTRRPVPGIIYHERKIAA